MWSFAKCASGRTIAAGPSTSEADDVQRCVYLEASTSIAANYRAARRGRSYDEFTATLGLVSEEADETVYWLVRLKNAGIGGGVELPPLSLKRRNWRRSSAHQRGRREAVVEEDEIAKTIPQRVDQIDRIEILTSSPAKCPNR